MSAPAAVVFDVDGTLADTERDGHRVAFNRAFAAHGVDVFWDIEHYGHLLAVTGGRRRIVADLAAREECGGEAADETVLEELAVRVHRTKTRLFADEVRRGAIGPRPGVRALVADLRAHGTRIAVATTGTRAWAEPLVEHLLGVGTAEVAVYGDDVTRLKPDPQAYELALARLGVDPADAVAVEDSAPGLAAARAAGLATVVVTNRYTRGQGFAGAALLREEFDEPAPLSAAELGALVRRDTGSRATVAARRTARHPGGPARPCDGQWRREAGARWAPGAGQARGASAP
ncbi:HAD-IA family hydrolase [Actinomycetospora sp. TBRC 11914]|uniref:HAD-IA family hydrolase n=1 Tax=Actinomycetospora sp. TBRC 11914 TaxID=2729387 RepID=UPI00145E9377|nr:HAD-IA family hydrolase [Actinomycetospora sp. TBRC 11914]NMO88969.1 HAD-IA family hydrolase [Actinomycetospora sp. TBRC 11914]